MQSQRRYLNLLLGFSFSLILACATEPTAPENPEVHAEPKEIIAPPAPNRHNVAEYDAAVNAYQNGNLQDAVDRLKDFIRKNTQSQHNLDAYLWLGRAYFDLTRFEEAKKAFTHYSSAKGTTPEGYEGKIWIGRALLASNKTHEALLISLEIIDLPSAKKRMSLSTYLTAFLIRADALIQLGRQLQASQALDAFQDEAKTHTTLIPKEVLAYQKSLQIRHKIKNCERFPEKGRLEEQQVRSQMQRRGICLYETIPIYEELLAQRIYPRIQLSLNEIVDAYRDYRDSCLSPPAPVQKRTVLQLKRYREELADVLKRDCQNYVKRTTYLLESWLSPDNRNFDSEDPLVKYVHELLTRIDQEYSDGNQKSSS